MRNTFWDKRIPTLLSIALIGISIVITSLLVKSGAIFIIRADVRQTPQNIKVTNISNTSFTISYTTDAENIGAVNFGEDKTLDQTALDDRDQESGLIRPHKVHNFTLKNLKPNTRYFFTIIAGENTFLNNNIPYETVTAPTPQITLAPRSPIKGAVLLPDGANPKEFLVYASIDKAEEISSLSKNDGTYELSLDSLLLQDLSYPATVNDQDTIKMTVTNGDIKSNVVVSAIQIDPVPIITLSNDYDFTKTTKTSSSRSSELSGSPSFVSEVASASAQSPSIIVPKKDQSFTDQQPVFRGTSSPNEKVKIIIRSPIETQTEVTADSFGNWFFKPPSVLSPGPHTILIQTKNKSGILQTITQSFVVLASALPSPSRTISRTPTPIPSPSLGPTSIPTPTIIVPTATQIPTPTPIIVASPTLSPQYPLGNSSILMTGIFGLSITLFGILLFVATRGISSK